MSEGAPASPLAAGPGSFYCYAKAPALGSFLLSRTRSEKLVHAKLDSVLNSWEDEQHQGSLPSSYEPSSPCGGSPVSLARGGSLPSTQSYVYKHAGLTVKVGLEEVASELFRVKPYVYAADDGAAVIVFSGALRNLSELAGSLARRRASPRGAAAADANNGLPAPSLERKSSIERSLDLGALTARTVLRLYLDAGLGADGDGAALLLSELMGEYAFVVYDSRRRAAFAARDPSGAEPLFYRLDDDGGVAFASSRLPLPDAERGGGEWRELPPGHYIVGGRAPRVQQYALTPTQLAARELQQDDELAAPRRSLDNDRLPGARCLDTDRSWNLDDLAGEFEALPEPAPAPAAAGGAARAAPAARPAAPQQRLPRSSTSNPRASAPIDLTSPRRPSAPAGRARGPLSPGRPPSAPPAAGSRGVLSPPARPAGGQPPPPARPAGAQRQQPAPAVPGGGAEGAGQSRLKQYVADLARRAAHIQLGPNLLDLRRQQEGLGIRQKTIDVKTSCACAYGRVTPQAGRGRGHWCGACLQARMGENVEEVLRRSDWRCPVCRGICNCSGPNCLRRSKGLLPTEQLVHEALHLGYKSVRRGAAAAQGARRAAAPRLRAPGGAARAAEPAAAAVCSAQVAHYLILTHLRESGYVPPVESLDAGALRLAQQQQAAAAAAATAAAGAAAASAVAATAREAAGRRAAAAVRQRQAMLEACELEFAPPEQHAVDALLAERGLALDVLDGADDSDDDDDPPLSAGLGATLSAQPGWPRAWLGGGFGAPAPGGAARPQSAPRGAGAMAPALATPGLHAGAPALPERRPSPLGRLPSPAVGAQAPPQGLAWPRDDGGAALMPPPAPRGQQQQQRQQQQQEQQPGQQGAAGEPPLNALQQQRLQRMQAADGSFSASDLPAWDAPGYVGERGAPAGEGGARQPAPASPRVGLPQAVAGGGVLAKAAGGAAGTFGAALAALGGSGTRRGGGSGTRAGGGGGGGERLVRGAVEAGAVEAPPGKRARLSDEAPEMDRAALLAAVPGAGCDTEAEEPDQLQRSEHSQLDPQQPVPEQPGPEQRDQQQAPPLSLPPPPCVGRPALAGAAAPSAPAADAPGPVVLLPSRSHEHLRMLELLRRLAALRAPGVVLRGGCPGYGAELVARASSAVLDEAFHNSGAWTEPVVVNHGFGAAVGDVEALRGAAQLLAELARLLPLSSVACDVVQRLQGQQPFLNFRASSPQARSVLLNACVGVITVLLQRTTPAATVAALETALAVHLPPPGPDGAGAPPPPSGALRAVRGAAERTVRELGCALAGVAGLCKRLLECMGELIDEVAALSALRQAPQDLLGPVVVGPIRWPAASQEQPAQTPGVAPALALLQLQQQMEAARGERLQQLESLAAADATLLRSLLANIVVFSQHLPRAAAAALLAGPQLGALLDLSVDWPLEVRRQALLALGALIRQAAPDMQADGAWGVQDGEQLLDALLQQRQQQEQQHEQQHEQQLEDGPASLASLAAAQHHLLLHALGGRLAPAVRLEAARDVAALVGQHALPPLELLVAAEYEPRKRWVAERLGARAPGCGAAAPQPRSQQGLLPAWLAQDSTQEEEERQRQASFALGTVKVDALAAAYALQLSAGVTGWPGMEQQLLAPASGLTQFGEHLQAPSLRRLALFAAARMVQLAPSLLRPGAAPGAMSASWLLRLWLRGLLDNPGADFGRVRAYATVVLHAHPATAPLFAACPWLADGGAKQELARDRGGAARAALARAVAAALASGAGRACGVGLPDVLDAPLVQFLRARQAELGSRSAVEPQTLLAWQRACMPSLLALSEEASSAEVAALMDVAHTWVRAGVLAVTGLEPRGGAGEPGSDGEALRVLQRCALAELRAYLGQLVALAGRGCLLDGLSAASWPAAVGGGGGGGALLPQLWPARRLQARLPCLRGLVGVLVEVLSAGDALRPHEDALLVHVAAALTSCSGLAAVGASDAAPTEAGAPGTPGSTSPGLLHLLLGTHVRLVLEASSDKPCPSTHRRAINALHLVRVLFAQPGLLAPASLQLLLPCLARPALHLLAPCAGGGGGCDAVQLQVLLLLQQLLCGPHGAALLAPPDGDAEGEAPNGQQQGVIDFRNGPLRRVTPLAPAQLRQLALVLLRASLQAVLALVAAQLGADAAPAVGHAAQPAASQASQAAAAPVPSGGAAGAADGDGALAPLQAADGPAAVQTLFCLTGPPAEVSSELSGWARADSLAGLPAGAAAAAVAVSRPADFGWRLARAGLSYAAALAQQGGAAGALALQAMPWLSGALRGAGGRGRPLAAAYDELLARLPPEQQPRFSLAAWRRELQLRQQQQQQQQQQQRERERRLAPGANAAGPALSSQACSVAVPRGRPLQEAGQARRGGAPPASQAFSQGGGRAASCAGAQGPQQPAGRALAAGPVAVRRCYAAADDKVDEATSSLSSRGKAPAAGPPRARAPDAAPPGQRGPRGAAPGGGSEQLLGQLVAWVPVKHARPVFRAILAVSQRGAGAADGPALVQVLLINAAAEHMAGLEVAGQLVPRRTLLGFSNASLLQQRASGGGGGGGGGAHAAWPSYGLTAASRVFAQLRPDDEAASTCDSAADGGGVTCDGRPLPRCPGDAAWEWWDERVAALRPLGQAEWARLVRGAQRAQGASEGGRSEARQPAAQQAPAGSGAAAAGGVGGPRAPLAEVQPPQGGPAAAPAPSCGDSQATINYEAAYVQHVGAAQAPLQSWKLALGAAACLVAAARLVLLFDAESSLRWRSIAVAAALAAQAALQGAAAAAAWRRKGWLAARHEAVAVASELLGVLGTVWRFALLKPSELPGQSALATMALRGYVLALDEVRLATSLPLLLFEGCVFAWLHARAAGAAGAVGAAARYVVWGQLVPLAAMLSLEARQRWRFVRHARPPLRSQGPWPRIIEAHLLVAHAARQVAAASQRHAAVPHWRSPGGLLLLGLAGGAATGAMALALSFR
ncbi:CDCA7L [Scenedesmus sp. PABB004]|nr:CDCA7L [Scenedesmus sp. PABB004]